MPSSKQSVALPGSNIPSLISTGVSVANFSVKYFQFLDETGRLAEDSPIFAQNNELLLEFYRVIRTLQAFDHKVLKVF